MSAPNRFESKRLPREILYAYLFGCWEFYEKINITVKYSKNSKNTLVQLAAH